MLLPLLVAAAAAAEPAPPLRLEPAFETVQNAREAGFSADGTRLAVGSNSEQIALWDTATGVQNGALAFKRSEAGRTRWCGKVFIALSHDGRAALLENECTVYRNPEPYTATGPIDYKRWTCVREAELELWDAVGEKLTRTLLKSKAPCRPTHSRFQPFQADPSIASFSPDGKRAVVSVPTGEREWRIDGYKSWLLNTDGGSPKPRALPGPGAFTAEGRLLSLKLDSQTAELRDEDSGKRVSLLQDIYGKPWNLLWSAGASRLLIQYKDGSYEEGRVWDAATGRLLHRERLDGSTSFSPRAHLQFSPDGRSLLRFDQAEYDKPVWLTAVDLASGQRSSTATVPISYSYNVLFSPDGRFASVSGRVFRASWDAPPAPAAAAAKAAAPALDVDAPLPAKTPADPDAYAVVVGIEKYRQAGLPGVDYAARDAATMRDYLVRAMGFDEANVVLLTNEQATKTDLEKHLGPWLANRVTAKSRVFVYYAGHGAPNPATGKGFLVPYEGDPNYTDVTGFPLQALYDALGRLPAKDVTVVLDACFSGSGGRSLLAKGARPLVHAVKASAAGNTTVLAAASGAQVSASYPQGRHGLLSYFLFEGLQGAADADKDGALTTAELFAHARARVEREARKQNLEQTPQLSGSASAVWLRR